MSMREYDQEILRTISNTLTEVELCEQYLQIANRYEFAPTLFFTGKCVLEEAAKIKKLMNTFDFTLGGHTYSAYQPKLLSRISKKVTGFVYPLKSIQKHDIRKTISIFEKHLSIRIKHWRNHCYYTNEDTYGLLSDEGIECVSNEVAMERYFPEQLNNNITSFPINTMPDHENLLHSPEHRGGLNPDDWVKENTKLVRNIVSHGGEATLLIHPLCMFLEDNFSAMKSLLNSLCDFHHSFRKRTIEPRQA